MPPEASATSDMPQIPAVEPTVPAAEPTAVDPNASPAPPTGDANLANQPTDPVVVSPVEPPRYQGTVAARMAELTTQRARFEQEATARDALIQRVLEQNRALTEALSNRQAPTATASPNTSTEFTDPRPSREAFGDPEAYESALIDWSARRTASVTAAELRRQNEEIDRQRNEAAENARREAEENAVRQRQEAEANRVWKEWQDRQAEFAQTHPDYYDALNDPRVHATTFMRDAIITRPNAPEIAYYLAKNPEESVRIASMNLSGMVYPPGTPQAGLPVPDALGQAFEIGLIAAKLQLAQTPTTQPSVASTAPNALTQPAVPATQTPTPVANPVARPVTSPPAPPTPIAGGSASANVRDIHEIGNEGSMEEYAAMRQQQLRQTRGLH